MKLKIGVLFGTRPEIIKLSPVLRLLRKTRANYFASLLQNRLPTSVGYTFGSANTGFK